MCYSEIKTEFVRPQALLKGTAIPYTDLDATHGLTWRITPNLLGILTKDGYFADTNPAWQKTLGWLPEEIHSHEFFEYVHPKDIAKTETALSKLKSGEPVLEFENRYRHKDGEYRWLSWNAIPDGDQFLCSARDITEAKKNAAALKTKEDEAKLREQFVAVLGHDLRNPLAALDSGLRLLSREPQTDKAKDILRMSDKSILRMKGLIDAVMDFARARLGDGLTVTFSQELTLKPALEHTIDEIRLIHPNAEIETHLDFTEPVGCDHGRICQVVSNLVSNAVTHGDLTHPITLTADDLDEHFRMIVSNGGPAIPSKSLKKLFQPFIREDNQSSQQGLGLGLFICAEIARAHGGTLTVESRDNRTTFTYLMKRDADRL